jgi:FMN phosphatase YigB (HAD superfamily)
MRPCLRISKNMQHKLLITDLDNTLYDWVSFFTASFRSMVGELTSLLGVPEETILIEFKTIHQRYGNSEQPFAVLELPSLQRKFSGLSRDEVMKRIDPALHRFNSTRKQTLALYQGVAETLGEIQNAGVKIVAHTEAILANSYWRLRALDIARYFNRLYTLEGKEAIHISAESRWTDPPDGFVTVLPRHERKPNPRLLADICRKEGADIACSYYLGDSLVRDVAMAKQAGVTAIWARYGTIYDPDYWTYLVKVTHWTDDDVRRENALREKYRDVVPDFTIDSFSQLKSIVLAAASKQT